MSRLRRGLARLASPYSPGFSATQRWLLLVLTLAAAVIRFAYQFDREFRGDEVGTLIHMDRSFPYLLTHCETWLTMNYFIVVEKLIGAGFGRGPLALGLLPLLAGVGLVPLLACLARRFTETRVALMAAALVALNPFLIDYSGRIRSYSLLAAGSLLLLLMFLNWYQRRSRLFGRLTAVAATALLLFHPLGLYPFLLVPGVLILDALTQPGRTVERTNFRTLLVPLGIGLSLVAVAYSGLFLALVEEGARWHVGRMTSFEYWPYLLSGYFGRGPLNVIFGLLGLIGAVAAWRRRSGFGLLLLGLVLPSLIMSVQGLAHHPWAYQRLLIFQLPVLFLLVAEGLCVLSGTRRGLAGLLLSLLLLGWWPGLAQLFEQKPRLTDSPLLQAAQFVWERFEPGDTLVADRRLDLLHLQNHLSPERYPARTLAQFMEGPADHRGRFFLWSPTPFSSSNPRLDTAAGSMLLYAGKPPVEPLLLLREDLLATVEDQTPGETLADCYALLCQLAKLEPSASDLDYCALWERHRIVTRRERVGRIRGLFH